MKFFLSKDYGLHLGINDKEYLDLGAKISNDDKEILANSDVIIQLRMLSDEKSSLIKENQNLIGIFNPYENKDIIENLSKKKLMFSSLEMLPRITRAQSMDILSSQANLAGYKAVIEAFSNFEKAVPMMMTAAGTIPAAKVLVVGAGVAGLQAIATAKRMGAIVFATDVRMASKEQVESLGGKFLTQRDLKTLKLREDMQKRHLKNLKKTGELIGRNFKKNRYCSLYSFNPRKKSTINYKRKYVKQYATWFSNI